MCIQYACIKVIDYGGCGFFWCVHGVNAIGQLVVTGNGEMTCSKEPQAGFKPLATVARTQAPYLWCTLYQLSYWAASEMWNVLTCLTPVLSVKLTARV